MEWVVSESKQIAKRRQTYLSASSLDESQQSAEAGSSLLTDPARGMVDEFGGIAQAELLADVHAMRVHGLDAEMQHAGDVMRLFALAEEAVDFELAIGERANGGRAAFRAGERVENLRGDGFTDGNAAAKQAANCVDDFLRPFLLHDVAATTGADDALGIQGFVMHGDDEHGRTRAESADVFEHFEAAFAGKAHIEQHKVWLEPFERGHGLHAIMRLTTDNEIGLQVYKRSQSSAEDGMIIDDEYALFGWQCWRVRFLRHSCLWMKIRMTRRRLFFGHCAR